MIILLCDVKTFQREFQVFNSEPFVVGVPLQSLKTLLCGLSVGLRQGRCSVAQCQPTAQCIAQLAFQTVDKQKSNALTLKLAAYFHTFL